MVGSDPPGRAGVGDLLLQGTRKGKAMGGKNSQEAFAG